MAHHTTRSLYEALSQLIDLPAGAKKIVITLEVGTLPTVEVTFPFLTHPPGGEFSKRFTLTPDPADAL